MIVFFGYANNDVTVHVPHVPVIGERVQATAVTMIDGGMTANAAVAAARMQATVAFAGAVGPDARSTEFLQNLEREGIDTSWSPRDGFLSTAIVLIAEGGERSIISQDDANDARRLTGVIDALARRGGGRIFLDGYRAGILPDERRAEVRLAMDLDGCTELEHALHAFRLADHVVLGRGLCDALGIEQAHWSALAAEYDTHIVVTDGERGWTLATPDGLVVHEQAVPVSVVDAVGAGDAFCGTYIAFIDAGRPAAEAAHLAGISAAIACATPGPRGAPRRTELFRFTQQHQQEIPL